MFPVLEKFLEAPSFSPKFGYSYAKPMQTLSFIKTPCTVPYLDVFWYRLIGISTKKNVPQKNIPKFLT